MGATNRSRTVASTHAFENPQVLKKQVWGATATWWYTAIILTKTSIYIPSLPKSTTQHWARLAPPTRKHNNTKSWRIRDSSVLQWTRSNNEAIAIGAGAKHSSQKKAPMADQPATNLRSQCVGIRDAPQGFAKIEVPQDGACMFRCLGKALFTDDKELFALQARAEVVSHMHRRQETYEPFRDKKLADDAPASNFQAYLYVGQKPATWGGWLELTAAARHWNARVIVVPER